MSHTANVEFEEDVQQKWEQYLIDVTAKRGFQIAVEADRRAKDTEDRCAVLGIRYE